MEKESRIIKEEFEFAGYHNPSNQHQEFVKIIIDEIENVDGLNYKSISSSYKCCNRTAMRNVKSISKKCMDLPDLDVYIEKFKIFIQRIISRKEETDDRSAI